MSQVWQWLAYTCTPVPLAKTITWHTVKKTARGTQKCLAVCQVGTDLMNPSQSLP